MIGYSARTTCTASSAASAPPARDAAPVADPSEAEVAK